MSFEDQFNPRINFHFVELEGRNYEFGFDYYSTQSAILVSVEKDYLPVSTVRFIGGIPWSVERIFVNKGMFSNLFHHFRFYRTYTIAWKQIQFPKITQEELVRIILKKMLDKV